MKYSLALLLMAVPAFAGKQMTAVDAIDLALKKADAGAFEQALKNGANIHTPFIQVKKGSIGGQDNYPVLPYALMRCEKEIASNPALETVCVKIIEKIANDRRLDLNMSSVHYKDAAFFYVGDEPVSSPESMSSGRVPLERALAMRNNFGKSVAQILIDAEKTGKNNKFAPLALNTALSDLRHPQLRAESLEAIKILMGSKVNYSSANLTNLDYSDSNEKQPLSLLDASFNRCDRLAPAKNKLWLKESLTVLYSAGVDLSKEPSLFDRALLCAGDGGIEAAQYLVELFGSNHFIDIDAKGRSRLHRMALKCEPEAVKFLITNGADVTLKDASLKEPRDLVYAEPQTKMTKVDENFKAIGRDWNADCLATMNVLKKQHTILSKQPAPTEAPKAE